MTIYPRIKQVKQFNKEATQRYNLACEEYKKGEIQNHPNYCFYVFQDEKTQELKQKGYVLEIKFDHYQLFSNKQKAFEAMSKIK